MNRAERRAAASDARRATTRAEFAPPRRYNAFGIAAVGAAIVYLLVAILWIALTTPVYGHSWYSGACCSDKDCAPIPRATVTATNEGYRVTLGTADHPMVAGEPVDEIVPYDKVLPSQDGDFHACIRPPVPPAMSQISRIICLYVPQGAEGA